MLLPQSSPLDTTKDALDNTKDTIILVNLSLVVGKIQVGLQLRTISFTFKYTMSRNPKIHLKKPLILRILEFHYFHILRKLFEHKLFYLIFYVYLSI